jgi:SAM-dependent methyltransferase
MPEPSSDTSQPPLLPRLDDARFVRREYSSGEAHAVRVQMFEELHEGPHADDVALVAVGEAEPARVLEVGCGDGAFAARMMRELGCEVCALDLVERNVALARDRGVDAAVADVQRLPFAAGTFDCVVAKWMLYHVPDLDAGLRELARVLRPGGRLVAATLSTETQFALWRMLGEDRECPVSFTYEHGGERLRRHFARVRRHTLENVLVFPSTAALRRYVGASMTHSHLAARVPELREPLRVPLRSCVFVAELAG